MSDLENDRCYIAIDMKSFYASVECVARGLDPLKANLLVADESRSDQTICLAVSPALKAIGVPGRPRLFEAKQAITRYEKQHRTKIYYITAVPRMAEYERVSATIYSVYLKYAAAEDIHVYSIDECFIDCTHYLHLSKVAMDIVAKKAKPDKDGVRIAELNEDTYKILLWDHQPLTDFWQIGSGKARRLESNHMYTMGDVAEHTQYDEEWFYKTFGVDAEILIDHAWGIEPVRMCDIKNYRSDSHSLSNGQVLPRPYKYEEARNVFCEMIDVLCCDMYKKNLISRIYTWWVSYDYKSLEYCPYYDGPLSIDYYGRLHPRHSGGTVRALEATSSPREVTEILVESFNRNTDHRLLYRRLGVCACEVMDTNGMYQLSLFTDHDRLDKERKLHAAMIEVRARYGNNAIIKGNNLLEGATTIERNTQIGGHRA